jgi:hypothetical protein
MEKALGAKMMAELPLEPKLNEDDMLSVLKENKALAAAFSSMARAIGGRRHS